MSKAQLQYKTFEKNSKKVFNKMNERADVPEDDALSELLEAAHRFHIDDDISSKFKKPAAKHPKFDPNNLIRKMAIMEPDRSICARDVHFLIKFYLHSTSASRYDVTSDGHRECTNLMKKYRVDRKAEGDNVTLHRIAASFPVIAVTILRSDKIDRRFTTEMLRTKDAESFPWSMRTQMCLSLVPSDVGDNPDRCNIVFAIIAFMYYENQVINEAKIGSTPTVVFEKVLNIAHAVYNDTNVAEDKKKSHWNHVIYDYTVNRNSVDGLLKHFRTEIPDAEAAFKNRFEFNEATVRNEQRAAPKPNKNPENTVFKQKKFSNKKKSRRNED